METGSCIVDRHNRSRSGGTDTQETVVRDTSRLKHRNRLRVIGNDLPTYLLTYLEEVYL